MRYIHFLFFVFLLSAFAGCKKDAEFVPEERAFVREFYVQGKLVDYDSINKAFAFTVGTPVETPYSNLYRNFGSFEIKDGYKRLTSGYYGLSSSDPVFQFSFTGQNPVDANSNPVWTKAETEALLQVNRVFKTGVGPGKVQLLYLVPLTQIAGLMLPAVSGSQLAEGELTIRTVEDYQFKALTITGITVNFTGKKVRCSFDGHLLRPVKVTGPGMYEYKEAQITNGEAVFFVQYGS